MVIEVFPTRIKRVQKLNHVTDKNRSMELDTSHRDRDDGLIGPTGLADLVGRAHRASLVDITENHAAEDRPVGVGVPRHHHHFDGQIAFLSHSGGRVVGHRGFLQTSWDPGDGQHWQADRLR